MNYKLKKSMIILLVFLLFFSVVPGSAEEQEQSPFYRLQEIIYYINSYYVQEVEIEDIIDNAIQGIFEELDQYSIYLTEEEYKEMQIGYEGYYGGIGLEITTIDDQLTVVSPIRDTPGERAGLQPGDVIYKINEQPTSEMSQRKAVDKMRGEEGTALELTIKREGEDELFTVDIIREVIRIPYVSGEILNDNIGHIEVYQFMEGVGVKIEDKIAELMEKGAKGLILDLRNNPGGVLEEAVDAASNFIEEGEIVSIKSRISQEHVYERNQNIKYVDLPVVVLINRGSASGSEIVAGAIQDHERGTIIGEKTFGKGSVQTIIPLADGSALQITTANFYLPSGHSLYEEAIKPDIDIKFDPGFTEDEVLLREEKIKINKNDSLEEIADRFNIEQDQLIEINQLEDPDNLIPGEYLIIPGLRDKIEIKDNQLEKAIEVLNRRLEENDR